MAGRDRNGGIQYAQRRLRPAFGREQPRLEIGRPRRRGGQALQRCQQRPRRRTAAGTQHRVQPLSQNVGVDGGNGVGHFHDGLLLSLAAPAAPIARVAIRRSTRQTISPFCASACAASVVRSVLSVVVL